MAANSLENQLPRIRPSDSQVQQFDEENYNNWKEKGVYKRNGLVYIPLSMVSFKSRDQGRYKPLVDPEKGIPAEGCKPVETEKIQNGKWELTDGNHRCAALKELGYSVVPAIVEGDCYECPVSPRTAEFFDDKMLARQILKDLKEKCEWVVEKYIEEAEEIDATSLSLCLNLERPETIVIVIPRSQFKADSGPGQIKIYKENAITSDIITPELTFDVDKVVTSTILIDLLNRCAVDLGL